MFHLNTPITIVDGWARPAGPNDVVWGFVCGPVDHDLCKISVSKADAPDRIVEFYYDAREYGKDKTDRLVQLYSAYINGKRVGKARSSPKRKSASSK